MSKPILSALILLASVGCAHQAAVSTASRPPGRRALLRLMRSQLAGHLERARGCLTESRMRDPRAAALVHYAFTIQPSGRVRDVQVDAWSSDEYMLAACVRSRMVSLFFDPAPPREVRIERTFYSCPDEEGGLCRLDLAGARGALMERARAGLARRDEALERCAARAEGEEAVLDVRLELGEDGRIMAGRLARSFPEDSPLRRCAVQPLLGLRLEGEPPGERVDLRYVYRLRAASDRRTASR